MCVCVRARVRLCVCVTVCDSLFPPQYGSTPLHVTAFYNKPEVAKLLLENGAKVNARTKVSLHPNIYVYIYCECLICMCVFDVYIYYVCMSETPKRCTITASLPWRGAHCAAARLLRGTALVRAN